MIIRIEDKVLKSKNCDKGCDQECDQDSERTRLERTSECWPVTMAARVGRVSEGNSGTSLLSDSCQTMSSNSKNRVPSFDLDRDPPEASLSRAGVATRAKREGVSPSTAKSRTLPEQSVSDIFVSKL